MATGEFTTGPAIEPVGDGVGDGVGGLHAAMRESEPHRQELLAELSPLFRQVMHEALCCLETALPDFREPGSADAKLHNALRRAS